MIARSAGAWQTGAMAGFVAFVVASVVAWLPHLIFGSRLDVMTDFLLGSVLGGAAYIFTFYQLKKWQSGL
jgi:cyanate permease